MGLGVISVVKHEEGPDISVTSQMSCLGYFNANETRVTENI